MASFLQRRRSAWALALLFLCVVVALFYLQGRRYLQAIDAVEHSLQVQQAIDETLSILKDVETGQRGFLLTGDERFLAPYTAARRDLAGSVARLRALVRGSPAQEARVDQLAALSNEKLDQGSANIALYRAGHAAEAVAAVRSGKGRRLMDRIRAVVDAMNVEEARALSVRSSVATASQRRATLAVVVSLLTSIGLVVFGLVTVSRDVRAVRSASERLAESEERFHRLADSTFEAIALIDADGIRDVNATFVAMYGYRVAELAGLRVADLVVPEARAALDEQLAAGEATTVEHVATRRDGERFPAEVRVRRVLSGDARLDIVVVRDISEQKRVEAALEEQAEQLRALSLRDALTGLYNRRGLLELGQQMLRLAARDKRWVAVHFVDLNGLKAINDEHGHDAGDGAIGDAGELLRSTARDADVVARLGGDELVVLAADTSPDLAEHFRARLRERLRDFNDSAVRVYRLSFSIGTAYFDPAAPASMDQLLARADALMYDAKLERRRAGSASLLPPRR